MRIDLTEAAKFYGLHKVPPVVYDPDYVGENIAGFNLDDRKIHYGDFPPASSKIMKYLRERFAKAGVGHLAQEDLVRFTFAHELYHAFQYERDPEGVRHEGRELTLKMEEEDLLAELGLLPGGPSEAHDEDPLEIAADKHAAQAYKLVKIAF